MFDDLLARIELLRSGRERVVVAISGFGGAGKSTLADRLRDHYGLRESQIIRLDSFILDRGTGEGMLGGFDWRRVEALLSDVPAGRRIVYQHNDFGGGHVARWSTSSFRRW